MNLWQQIFDFICSRIEGGKNEKTKQAENLAEIYGLKLVKKKQSCPSQRLFLFGIVYPTENSCDADPSTSGSSEIVGSQALLYQQAWERKAPAGPALKPVLRNPEGQETAVETIVNVLTSMPYIHLGLNAPRKDMESTLYANSLIGVGVVSSLYHSSRGKLRKHMQWADHAMIAATSICLSRKLCPENPKMVSAALAALLPFQPLMVTLVNTGIMEVAFAKKAIVDPKLRKAHRLHAISSLLGGVLFFGADRLPGPGYAHAAWHLAAAAGVATYNMLLK